ncbi:MAG: hypothetical protein J1E59_04435 [Treponema sp.]|nr:hypothetical protein [Treponema sp.]
MGSLTQAFGLLPSFGLPKTRTKASKKQPPIILIPFEVLSHTPPASATFARIAFADSAVFMPATKFFQNIMQISLFFSTSCAIM